MSISAEDSVGFAPALRWGGFAAFCLAFSRVYDVFGHGVTSPFMENLFWIPLAGVFFWLLCRGWQYRPARRVQNCLFAALTTLTAGCLLQGILDIAGTSSAYIWLFFGVGGLWAAGFCLSLGRDLLLRKASQS